MLFLCVCFFSFYASSFSHTFHIFKNWVIFERIIFPETELAGNLVTDDGVTVEWGGRNDRTVLVSMKRGPFRYFMGIPSGDFESCFMQISVPTIWAASSEFVSSSIPSWQILTAYAQPFRGARDLAFCLKVPHDSLLVWASSEGSGETARIRRLAWTFAARMGDKYQIRLTRSI